MTARSPLDTNCKIGSGATVTISNLEGPFTADAAGYLFLRINDSGAALGDNAGTLTVTVSSTN